MTGTGPAATGGPAEPAEPSLVERARAGDLSAWRELLPPGWLDRYHMPPSAEPAPAVLPAPTPSGSPSPVGRRIAAVVAVLSAVGLLIAGSALPPWSTPRRAPAPVTRPWRSAPVLQPEPTVGPSTRPTPTPSPSSHRTGSGGPARYSGYPRAVPAYPRWGYAWMDRATAPRGVEARLDPQWQWTSSRLDPAGADRRATAVHRGTGRYTVRLPGAGFPLGVAHATSFAAERYYYAPADDGHSCAVAGYRQSGADELVDVRCHDSDGEPVDVQFDVFFSAPNAGPGPYAAVRYDPPGGAGSRSPVRNSGTWNTAGGAVAVHHLGTGRWRATLSGSALAAGTGYVHVTAYGTGTPARCRPVSSAPAGSALAVVVACDAISTGAARPVNAQWTLTYTGRAGLPHAGAAAGAYATTTGDPADPAIDRRRSWASNGETPTVRRFAVGGYRVAYDGIGRPDDAPVVTAVGALPRHCRLSWWDSYSRPPRVTIDVYCFDQAGNRADALFAVAYLRSP